MTSSACQLGELTTLETATKASSNGPVALQVLPFEAWQLVEHEEFDVNHSIAACDDSELLAEQQQKQSVGSVGTYNRSQTRSGSSDSGQLSLLSSFGSISFGGYHINSSHQRNNTNPSSDTASHQSMSVDIDQHQFYCSLMLLNSLDFCHYEHQKANNKNNNSLKQRQQHHHHHQQKQQQATGLSPSSLKTPNLTLSQAELSNNYGSTLDNHQHHKGSLQDCHSHWFPCEKEAAAKKLQPKNISLELDDNNRDKAPPIKSKSISGGTAGGVAGRDSNSGNKKRGAFGLSILGGNNWQGQGAGKLVAAAAAATNSSGFVDKLLAHMINRRNGVGVGGGVNANGRSAGSMSSAKKSNKGGSKHHQETTTAATTTMNKSRDKSSTQKEHVDGGLGGVGVGCPKSGKTPIVSVEQAKKQKTTTQSTGGIHLLSDLSRRLARHCGVKTKEAVRLDGSCDGIGGGGCALGTSSKSVQTTSESGAASGGSFSASLKQSDTFSELWQSSGQTPQQHQQEQGPMALATATARTTTAISQPPAIAGPTKFNEQSRQQRERALMDGSTTTSGGTITPKSINFVSSEPPPLPQQQQQQLLNVNPTRLGQHSSHHQLFQVQSSTLSPEHKEAASARASVSSFNHIININNVSGNFISSRNNLDELAADSGEGGIKPLDYVARGPFDSYHEDESHHHQQEQQQQRQHLSVGASLDPKSTKSASSSRLLSVASCGGGSSRKLSTKEKCKRQKDAERVEKLRLLVNYLKSGSSQPVVSPVTLEADEIELAERYKMHVTLRDDMLHDILANDSHHHQHHHHHHQEHMTQSVGGSRPNIVADHNVTTSTKSEPAGQAGAPGKISTLTTNITSTISKNNSLLINHSIGGTSASSPVSSSSTSSMNHVHHHSVHDGRSIVRIGDVTWVLRHSVSDPGNNFEHSPAFSTASSSPPTKHHKHHLHHHNHHHHHHHHHRNHSTHDGPDHNSLKLQLEQSPQEQQQPQQQHQEPQQSSDLCSSCAPSSGSYSGSSLSNYCLASGSSGNKGSGCNATQQQQHPQQQTSSPDHPTPKMFYIGDMDMIPVFSPSLLNTSSTSAASLPLAPVPMHQQQQTSTPLTTANSTNCCSQPSTPVIYTNLSTSNINNNNNNTEAGACGDSLSSSNRNSSSTSAWTNPQNLATWIDNEVNSLVHDLEAKSQQLQIRNESKHNKSGKKKWLSVTSSHSKLAQD